MSRKNGNVTDWELPTSCTVPKPARKSQNQIASNEADTTTETHPFLTNTIDQSVIEKTSDVDHQSENPTLISENNSPETDPSEQEKMKNSNHNTDRQSCQPLLSQLRTQFKQFCETTSLRGVPRIVNQHDAKRRLLWVVFVLVFFIGCIICLTFIINQYLEFDVIHQPKKIYDAPRSFPSVTLCNLRPFSTRDIRKLKAAGVIPVDMYFDSIGRMMSSVKEKYRLPLTTLWSMQAYISNLPESVDKNSLGHSLEDIVKRCFVIYKTGSMTRGTDCERSGYWTKTQNSVFHNCYTYTVYENRSDMALNMELVVYLDNLVEHTDCFDCQERVRASQLTGARLLLHPRASYPRVAEEGINLMPGTMTDIRFSVYEWSMMEPPHGRCSPLTPPSIRFDGVNYTYSEEACNALREQEKMARTCDCLSQSAPAPTYLLSQGLRKCQELKLPATYDVVRDLNHTKQRYFNDDALETFFKYASCAERVGTGLDSYKIGCRPACTRYTYKPSITAAQWPTKTFLTWFVTKFLKKNSNSKFPSRTNLTPSQQVRQRERHEEMERILEPYSEIANLTRDGKQDEAIKNLLDLQVFERNFLSIVISRPNFDLERVEEKAVVSLTSLFSQIGGLLSIWIGLTFVCIVELVELALNVADTVWHYQRK